MDFDFENLGQQSSNVSSQRPNNQWSALAADSPAWEPSALAASNMTSSLQQISHSGNLKTQQFGNNNFNNNNQMNMNRNFNLSAAEFTPMQPHTRMSPNLVQLQQQGLHRLNSGMSTAPLPFNSNSNMTVTNRNLPAQMGRGHIAAGMLESSMMSGTTDLGSLSVMDQNQSGFVEDGISAAEQVVNLLRSRSAIEVSEPRKLHDSFVISSADMKIRLLRQNGVISRDVSDLFIETLTQNEMEILLDMVNQIPNEFSGIYPLDKFMSLQDYKHKRSRNGTCGLPSGVFKVISRADGYVYCIRRVDGPNLVGLKDLCSLAERQWSPGFLSHSGIIPLRHAFPADGALFLVHDYIPGAMNLVDFLQTRANGPNSNRPLDEKVLWSALVQLLTALQAVHSKGLTCRSIIPQRILVSSGSRFRFGSCGLHHLLHSNDNVPLKKQMQQDLFNLGRIILCLASLSIQAFEVPNRALEVLKKNYSLGLSQVVSECFGREANVEGLLIIATPKIAEHLSNMYSHIDALESELGKMVVCEELLKLITKLFVVKGKDSTFDDDESHSAVVADKDLVELFSEHLFPSSSEINLERAMEILARVLVHSDSSTQQCVLRSKQGMLVVVSFESIRKAIDHLFRIQISRQNAEQN